jgi:hypothetical protein
MKEEKDPRTVWDSLKRGWRRNAIIFALAVLTYNLVETFPILFGPVWAPLVRNMSLTLFLLNCVDIILRITQPYLNSKTLGDTAEKDPIGAAIVFAARAFLTGVILMTLALSARGATLNNQAQADGDGPTLQYAFYRTSGVEKQPGFEQRALNLYLQAAIAREARNIDIASSQMTLVAYKPVVIEMPANAKKNSPILLRELKANWPAVKQPSLNAAQIEQETCRSLVDPRCWTSEAQLNVTSKHGVEKGRGFGQLTAVWRADGSLRFDNIGSMRVTYPRELGNYGWDNWNDPDLSMRAYVLFMRDTCKAVPSTVKDEVARFKMCLSGYNGGMGGLKNDILSCRATKGCDPAQWDGNVELTSAKSKTRVPGYGQSAFDTNRGYVKLVAGDRRKRYLSLDRLVV